MSQLNLEFCPSCRFSLVERTTYCPHCGHQLTYPKWKKVGAWILLILIVYGLVRCHLAMLDGLDGLVEDEPSKAVPGGTTTAGVWPHREYP